MVLTTPFVVVEMFFVPESHAAEPVAPVIEATVEVPDRGFVTVTTVAFHPLIFLSGLAAGFFSVGSWFHRHDRSLFLHDADSKALGPIFLHRSLQKMKRRLARIYTRSGAALISMVIYGGSFFYARSLVFLTPSQRGLLFGSRSIL